MSDDTPTQKFPSQGDDVQEDLQEEKQKSKGLLIGLIAAGALLLAAIIVLGVFLLRGQGDPVVADAPTPSNSNSPTPGASATPEASATPTPSATVDAPGGDSAPPPPPPPTGAAFSSFNPTSQVRCEFSTPNFTPPTPIVEISWATIRADSAWIVQGTSDAADSGFMQIPLNGNQSDFPYELQFPCFQANATFTITLVGSDGHHVSKSWTIKNIGDKN
jgi:hypothetical protein